MNPGNTPPILTGCDVLPSMGSHGNRPPNRQTATERRRGQRPTAGRFQEINAFVDATLRELARAEIAVWLILWRDTKADGLARTSQADLARRGGFSERTAGRAVNSLRKAGLLTVVCRGGVRRGPSTYRLHPHSRVAPPDDATWSAHSPSQRHFG
ncbi:MAG: helix-turn-helix domain-containing protein [Planctomycetales bacterium]